MHKFVIGAALLVGLAPLTARAQVSKFSWTLGGGVQQFRSNGAEGQFSTNKASIPHFTVGLCYDQPLYSPAPEQALGLSAGLQGGFFVIGSDDEPESGFTADVPLYATYRYGAKSTKKSDKSFGLGVGGGVRAGHMWWGMADAPISRSYAVPSAMLEGVYSATRSDYYLRLLVDLGKVRYYNYYTSEGRVEVASFQSLQLQLGYTF